MGKKGKDERMRIEENEDWLHQKWQLKPKPLPRSISYPTPLLQSLQSSGGISGARSEHSEAKLCHCKKNEVSQSAVPAERLRLASCALRPGASQGAATYLQHTG